MKKLLLSFTLLLGIVAADAQDFHFSQFYNSPLTLNPALTGLTNGGWRIGAIYRNQWYGTETFGKPSYMTPSASFDVPIRIKRSALGIGLLFVNDRVGGGLMQDFSGGLSLSYIQSMGKNRNHQLSLGIQGMYTNRQFDTDALQFASQFSGTTYDPTATGEVLEASSFHQIDANAGLMWYGNFSKKFAWYMGGVIYNIARPDQGYLQNSTEDYFMRYTGHTGMEINIGKQNKFSLLPSVLFMHQDNVNQLNGGMALGFNFTEKTTLFLGGYARANGFGDNVSMDAAISYLGIEISRFRLGASYDYTLSDFQEAVGNTGALEFSLMYTGKAKTKATETPEIHLFCPRF